MLNQRAGEQKQVADLDETLTDLLALNKALYNKNVTDLLDRAKHHLAYASPAGIGLGTLFAVLSIGIVGVGLAITCPPILMVGLLGVLAGVIMATVSAAKIHTQMSLKLFDIAKSIQPVLDTDTDLFGRHPHHAMSAW